MIRKPPPIEEEEEEPEYNIDEEDEAIDNPMVIERYKQSAFVARRVLEMLIEKCTPGVNITTLCEFGDNSVFLVCKEHVKEEEVKYGIAVPTTVSPGTIICNYSPSLLEDKESKTILPGQEVRIDVGVHVDGYVSCVGTTVYLPRQHMIGGAPRKSHESLVSEEDRTRTLCAAKRIMDLTMRMVKPGMNNFDIGVMTKKLCTYYGVEFLRGLLSHEISRYVLRGSQVILHRPTEDVQVFEHKFKKNEVYVLDIAVSSNPKNLGRTREKDPRPNLYRREICEYKMFLKNESSTRILKVIDKEFDNFYFPMRKIYENKGHVGFVELKQKGLVSCLPVLHGRKNECIVRLVATVALTEHEVLPFCVPPLQNTYLKDQLKLTDQKMINILRTNLKFSNVVSRPQQQQQKQGNEKVGDGRKVRMDTRND